ncbi:class I SAM-dependent methyltransferase [Thalassolituus sp. LLYu03]|uniref:class I SAM-dependent methyltransferase n=1 Tax=Thalassolituus sp. LLYu03 TaxID=3421656 RepID=UPI003D27FB6D
MPAWNSAGLTLECFPPLPEHVAQPWDAADDYLLSEADTRLNTLIINDRFGALTCALPSARLWNDSASALSSARHNLALNALPAADARMLATLADLPADTRQILLQMPKSQDQLHEWLTVISTKAPAATILLAGMAKHIPIPLLNWLQANADHYQQLPIRKKARLMRLQGWNKPLANRWKGYRAFDLSFEGRAGVFGREKLDIGSQVLLKHLTLPDQGTVIDIGCGNGLLALVAKSRNTALNVIATDDSQAATESAAHNAQINGLDIQVRHGDILSAVTEKADLILCNPPFHDGHTQLTNIAQRMFEESAEHLTANGQLLVIANRHLPYLPLLRNSFRNVEVMSADQRFSVYACRR